MEAKKKGCSLWKRVLLFMHGAASPSVPPRSFCSKRKAQLAVLVEVYGACQQHLVHNTYLTFRQRYLPHVTSRTVKGVCLHPHCYKC